MEWEKSPSPVQAGDEPLGLSRAGRSVPVSSMPLKGTGEARGKPPRSPAWLRDHMVSPNEADKPTGKLAPVSILCLMGQSVVDDVYWSHRPHRGSLIIIGCPKDDADTPDLPRVH
jgi:hypothetical protein